MKAAIAGAALLASCVSAPPEVGGPTRGHPAVAAVALPELVGASRLRLDGAAVQGGLVRGQVPPGTELTLDGRPVAVAADGAFILGFDRDAGASAVLVERYAGPMGNPLAAETRLAVAPGAWRIERVNAPYRAGRTDAEFDRLRPGELARIAAARATATDAEGWRQRFRWPATGRQSGWFGAQRVYQGKPGGYHGGADVAVATGTPVVAPADGVVILAADAAFTLEGRLLMIDHGQGLSSALLHLSRIDVEAGAPVRQGQVVGLSGATGRVSGPHLHWGLQWRGAKLDPLKVAGPVQAGSR